MTIRHTVVEGDSLWRLAHRHLGSGKKWPIILNTHNKEAARFGQHSPLIPIENENLIYVGQTLVIPVSKNDRNEEGKGSKKEGSKRSVPLNLRANFTIGKDTAPIMYVANHADFTIKAEMSGDIGIVSNLPDRYQHTIEILMSKNPSEAKLKLAEIYDPAIVALTTKPEVAFESGRVKIKSAISANAGLGPYTFGVQTEAPNHMSGTLKAPPASGTIKVKGQEYKFEAAIELRADIIWHPRPKGVNEELVKVKTRSEQPVFIPQDQKIDWTKLAENADKVLVVVAISIISVFFPQVRMAIANPKATMITTPYNHSIYYRGGAYPGDA